MISELMLEKISNSTYKQNKQNPTQEILQLIRNENSFENVIL